MRTKGEPNTSLRSFEYRLPRLQTGFRFWLQAETDKKGMVAGVCTDISSTGLGADLEECLPVGSPVTLVLPCPSRREPLLIRARVVSQEAQRHGFAFRSRRSSEKVASLLHELAAGENLLLQTGPADPSKA